MIKMGMTNVEFAQQYETWKNFRQDQSVQGFSNFVEAQYNQARIDWLVDNHSPDTTFDGHFLRNVFSGSYDYSVQEWLDTPEEEEVIPDPEPPVEEIEPPIEDEEEYIPEPEMRGASYLDN